nr:MAG TPA: hypothetical protein [Bacteriophage sp.]
MDSGITADKVATYNGYQAIIEGKQNKLVSDAYTNISDNNKIKA